MEDLDSTKLEEEVAKVTGEETPSETTAEEKPTEEKPSEEKPSQEETHEDTTSLKSEEKPLEEEIDGLPKEYHKDPRWQKLKQDRDVALERAKVADELEEKLGDLPIEELTRLKNAGSLLRKYPQLAEKVQKVIDEHTYVNEETKTEIDTLKQDQENLRYELALDRYDKQVEGLITEHKVDKEIEPLVKEVFENRVINQKLDAKSIPQAFEKALKDVNLAYRKKLASHIETKKGEPKVPASPPQKGKVIVTKSEATDIGSVINEFAEGLKSNRGEPVKE